MNKKLKYNIYIDAKLDRYTSTSGYFTSIKELKKHLRKIVDENVEFSFEIEKKLHDPYSLRALSVLDNAYFGSTINASDYDVTHDSIITIPQEQFRFTFYRTHS